MFFIIGFHCYLFQMTLAEDGLHTPVIVKIFLSSQPAEHLSRDLTRLGRIVEDIADVNVYLNDC